MTAREMIGYLMLVLLLGSIAAAWWRWRRAVREDRLLRWGTPKQTRNKRR